MILVTDKLEKTDLKYDLLDEEKRDLSKDERIEYVPIQHPASRLIYVILVGLALTAATWLMFANTTYTFINTSTREFDTKVTTSTQTAVNETELILSKVQDSVDLIRSANAEMALKYVEAIKQMLQDRTRYAVNAINLIVTDKIREIENEMTSFDYVIADASAGIVDYTLQDMKTLRDSIPSITNETYRTDLENVFDGVQKKLNSAFEDLDEMYTFYGSYMADIIDHKVENATDRIRMLVNSNRRQCECTIKEKINFCYNISTQNVKISRQIESLIKVFGILNNTTDILDTLEPVMLKKTDQQTCTSISEARLTLNKALVKSETLLEVLLKDDNCYLGSAVRKEAYKSHGQLKQYITNNFETSIWSLSKRLNDTTAAFQVVKESHRKQVEEDLTKGLEALTKEILAKTKSLGPTVYDEYQAKAPFPDVRSWMDTKFQNVTDVINPMFVQRQSEISEALKYNLQNVVFRQVPFVSSLSIQNFLPNDVCPVSTDYQKFVAATLDGLLDPTNSNARQELVMSNKDLAKEVETAQLVSDDLEDAEANQSENDGGKTTTISKTIGSKTSASEQNTDDDAIVQEIKHIIEEFAGENGLTETPEVQVMVLQIPNDADDDQQAASASADANQGK